MPRRVRFILTNSPSFWFAHHMHDNSHFTMEGGCLTDHFWVKNQTMQLFVGPCLAESSMLAWGTWLQIHTLTHMQTQTSATKEQVSQSLAAAGSGRPGEVTAAWRRDWCSGKVLRPIPYESEHGCVCACMCLGEKKSYADVDWYRCKSEVNIVPIFLFEIKVVEQLCSSVSKIVAWQMFELVHKSAALLFLLFIENCKPTFP